MSDESVSYRLIYLWWITGRPFKNSHVINITCPNNAGTINARCNCNLAFWIFGFLASLGLHTLFNSCSSSVFLSAAEAVESVHQARPVRHHRQRTLNRGPIGYRAPSHRATTELQLCPPNINHLFVRTQQHRLRTKHSQGQTTYTTYTAVRYTQSSHVQRRVIVLLAIS